METNVRNAHLKKILTGEIQGPLTGKMHIDKPWLKNFNDDQINHTHIKRSMYENLYQENKNYLDEIAMYYMGENSKYTYGELFEEIDNVAKSFHKFQIKKGDVVSIISPNTPEAIFSIYALNKIGAIVNVVHPLLTKKEYEQTVEKTKSKMIVVNSSNYNKVKDIDVNKVIVGVGDSMPKGKIKTLLTLAEALPKLKSSLNSKSYSWNHFLRIGQISRLPRVMVDSSDTAILFHTGGTTGESKLAEITNDNINYLATNGKVMNDNIDRGDKLLAIMPIFHGMGFANCLHSALVSGVSAVVMPKFIKNSFEDIMTSVKPNHIFAVPAIFNAMMKSEKISSADLSFIKLQIIGGDKPSVNLLNDYKEFSKKTNIKEPMLCAYGLTEAVAAVTQSTRKTHQKQGITNIDLSSENVGNVFISNNIKIVKPSTAENLSYNEIGEILVEGPTVMKGYYKNEEATEKVIKDGWLHTGDFGFVDNDGLLHYTERLKRLIISNGYNIYPSEIEKVANEINFIENSVAVGVADKNKGEIPVLFVKVKSEDLNNEVTQSTIMEKCNSELSVISKVRDVVILDEFPLTKMNKVDTFKLAAEYKEKYTKEAIKVKIK